MEAGIARVSGGKRIALGRGMLCASVRPRMPPAY